MGELIILFIFFDSHYGPLIVKTGKKHVIFVVSVKHFTNEFLATKKLGQILEPMCPLRIFRRF